MEIPLVYIFNEILHNVCHNLKTKFLNYRFTFSETSIMNKDAIVRKIEKIKFDLEQEFEAGGYKITNAHFENGLFLHSEQFYFAKRYFLNSGNCDDISELLVSKLEKFKFSEPTTLIGFRSYTGLLLNKTVESLKKKGSDYNYAIIEHDKTSFIWQHLPDLKNNLVIILPITCTCSAYSTLREFVIKHLKNKPQYKNNPKVNKNFINVFLILEKSLKAYESREIVINELDDDLSKIYSPFDWSKINNEQIVFTNKQKKYYFANPLIRLYSKMYLPELCPLCFPLNEETSKEKPLFPTHANYETPNLIFEFPNFCKETTQQKETPKQTFFSTFHSDEELKKTHLYGHIIANESSYANYIRGNEFYLKNKDEILKFFNMKLSETLSSIAEVIFITASTNHNSNFLEDISTSESLKGKSVTILQFHPSKEFVDNFISLYSKDIQKKTTKIIYFDDVMSAGKTFKLVSDYIKHAKKSLKVTGRHGFDFVFTLVDRTPLYTRNEILKKIYSQRKNPKPEENFIAFFRLNVPIISASHLPNPLQEKIVALKNMIDQCHLDSLKMTIGREILKNEPRQLPELHTIKQEDNALEYFPFEKIERDFDEEKKNVYELYQPGLKKGLLDLLKLFLAHELNTELSDKKYQNKTYFKKFKNAPGKFIAELIKAIKDKTKDDISNYFGLTESQINKFQIYRKLDIEERIIDDTIVKILSRPPFIYYKNIYESIFHYCINELKELYEPIKNKRTDNFEVFRKLKFYLRRSVELNSNFLVSLGFIQGFKQIYNDEKSKNIINYHNDSLRALKKNKELKEDYRETAIRNVEYKKDQISSYFAHLFLYYKELMVKKPSISIKLEELINSKELLPEGIYAPKNSVKELKNLITDQYFQFTGTLKAENVYLLSELKEIHKENVRKQIEESKFGNQIDFFDLDSIRKFYFQDKRNNPKVLNAIKLVSKSRHNPNNAKDIGTKENYEDIINSVCQMLLTASTLEKKQTDFGNTKKSYLNEEIKQILDSAIKIIQPLNKPKLEYAFFVEFRKKTGDMPTSNYIYSLISSEESDDSSTVELNEEGLVYNLLYGLFDDKDFQNEQTLLAGVNLSTGKTISFKNTYFYHPSGTKRLKSQKFSKLYENDIYSQETKKGMKFLGKSQMTLVLRLANMVAPNKIDNHYKLEGRAVLLITTTMESNTGNFVDFMSNEKIRLLLLIKEELLAYLQKQFDNDAFMEVFENKRNANYRDKLRHDLKETLGYLKSLFDNSRKNSDGNNKKLFDLILASIKFQLLPDTTSELTDKSHKFTAKAILEIFRLVFDSVYIMDISIDLHKEVDTTKFNLKELKTNQFAFTLVVLEIITNMKKYCPRHSSQNKGLSISFDPQKNAMCFKNKHDYEPGVLNSKKDSGGLSMCKDIMIKSKLGYIVDDKTEEDFIVEIIFTK